MSAAIPPTDVPLPDRDDVQFWATNARVSIVRLKGAEDYDEWYISIEMQARIMGLSKHFSGETPHSDDTDKYHAVLTSIVWQSLSQRMQRNLTHAGWSSRLPITRMMNFIKVDCGFEADIAIIELLARFSESNRLDRMSRYTSENHPFTSAREMLAQLDVTFGNPHGATIANRTLSRLMFDIRKDDVTSLSPR
ncbi:uncharacterized protein CPUR_06913 [Claviceps purpurea 20.1]|uniref:Uncharacterized protein n=1 Tax=Claviceps purpurea (strain 20.1) TaxID=1111077 RepID=M1WAF5_CLAP2|nr:uncharacterized protein CPUR_06913 [Claviceps purpurea 20.1]